MPQISTSSFASIERYTWEYPCETLQTAGPTGFLFSGDAGGTYGTVPGKRNVPAGKIHGCTLIPFSGQSGAGGPGQIRSVTDISKSKNRTSLPSRIMLHMLLSRAQYLRCRRECVDVSYRPAVAMAIDISSYNWFPSDVLRSEFKSPAGQHFC